MRVSRHSKGERCPLAHRTQHGVPIAFAWGLGHVCRQICVTPSCASRGNPIIDPRSCSVACKITTTAASPFLSSLSQCFYASINVGICSSAPADRRLHYTDDDIATSLHQQHLRNAQLVTSYNISCIVGVERSQEMTP